MADWRRNFCGCRSRNRLSQARETYPHGEFTNVLSARQDKALTNFAK
ncbi:MAG: hypothetical protein KME26_09285 [Oscillatoria princeps RMCB-10]|nr:hypothetical protein [Oscillatoria princeps RMCB-10]